MAGTKTKAKGKVDFTSVPGLLNRPDKVRDDIKKYDATIDASYVELAELLHEAYKEKFHIPWGYSDFEEFIKTELSIGYRKAMYLIKIWEAVAEFGLPKERVKEIGWSKMREIVRNMNYDNAEDLVDKAEKLTVSELRNDLKEEEEGIEVSRSRDSSDIEAPEKVTMKLIMNTDEASIIMDAIDNAKGILGTTNETVALEYICQEWHMNQGSSGERVTLDVILRYVHETFGVSLVPEEVEEKASSKAEEPKGEDDIEVEPEAELDQEHEVEPEPEPEVEEEDHSKNKKRGRPKKSSKSEPKPEPEPKPEQDFDEDDDLESLLSSDEDEGLSFDDAEQEESYGGSEESDAEDDDQQLTDDDDDESIDAILGL